MSLLQSQVEIDHMLTKTAYSEGYKKRIRRRRRRRNAKDCVSFHQDESGRRGSEI